MEPSEYYSIKAWDIGATEHYIIEVVLILITLGQRARIILILVYEYVREMVKHTSLFTR
tara:strand:- start:565 stop:741 length:177 start_codon:yes stop_codon:yes gene_type:complete